MSRRCRGGAVARRYHAAMPNPDIADSIADRIAQATAARDSLPPSELERWVVMSTVSNRPMVFPMHDGEVVGSPRLTARVEDATRFPNRRAASSVARGMLASDGTGAAKAVHLRDAIQWFLCDLRQNVQAPAPSACPGPRQGGLFE